MRVATAKVQVPAKGGKLATLLRGVDTVPQNPNILRHCSSKLAIGFLERRGFPTGYFHRDFLAGAESSFLHLAKITHAHDGNRDEHHNLSAVPGHDLLESSLRCVFSEGLESLTQGGFELEWNIEEVCSTKLGDVSLILGARRSRGIPLGEWTAARATYAGHTLVFRGKQRRELAQDGATVCVDVHVVAKQTILLKQAAENKVVAGYFDEASHHVVRLEAEMRNMGTTGSRLRQYLQLCFDDDHGWMISDFNSALNGNHLTAALPEAN